MTEDRGANMRVGVDGCKKGWFYVQFGNDEAVFGVVAELSLLLDSLPTDSVVLVDIPIGLREDQGGGGRLCDIEARKIRVFRQICGSKAVPGRGAGLWT